VRPSAVELFGDPGDAQRRRPHVDATPVPAEVEGHADEVDGPHGATLAHAVCERARVVGRQLTSVAKAQVLLHLQAVRREMYADRGSAPLRRAAACSRTCVRSGGELMKRFEVGARVVEPTYGLGSVVAVEDAYTQRPVR
jgi:hypothetical protein